MSFNESWLKPFVMLYSYIYYSIFIVVSWELLSLHCLHVHGHTQTYTNTPTERTHTLTQTQPHAPSQSSRGRKKCATLGVSVWRKKLLKLRTNQGERITYWRDRVCLARLLLIALYRYPNARMTQSYAWRQIFDQISGYATLITVSSKGGHNFYILDR